ncbi:MAG: amidohydrolase family protein [Saprospiraceae bacterium]
MRYYFFSIAILFNAIRAFTQPIPAKIAEMPYLITGVIVHVGNGEVLENQNVAVVNGRIEMNPDLASIGAKDRYKVIEAKGKHLYPGFIAPFSTLGLVEVEAVRATVDNVETGFLNPNARTIIAYNTDSEVTPTVRNNGVLLAQIVPSGGLICGQSSIVQLDAWNWEDAAYKSDEGLVMNWPNQFNNSGWWAEPGETTKEDRYKENVKSIIRLFDEAFAYSKSTNTEIKNLRLEAMKGLFDGSKNLYIKVSYAKPMTEAILFAQRYGIKPVIVGAEDAWRIADFLKVNKIQLILHRIQSLPLRNDDDVDQPYKQAMVLAQAGIPFCFSMDGAWQQRNLPFQAGQSVGYGLPYESAIQALTLDAARILKIDQKCGSIENGKEATFFISKGDALDMKTNLIEFAMIQGRRIVLDDKQSALYRKFNEKYQKHKK